MSKKFFGSIVIIIIIIGAAFLINSGFQPAAKTKESNVREFKIKAFRYNYDPNFITVEKGDKVKITINNADGLHGIRIPDLAASGDEAIEFTADKEGEFIWYCNNYCGDGHRQMQGKLIVQ